MSQPTGPATITAQTKPSASRDRAIAKLLESNSQPQSSPVQNPTQVAPEEMSAIRAPSQPAVPESTQQSAESRQSPPNEAQNSSPEATEVKTDEPISAQYAQLARKEKAVRAKVQEMKAAELSVKAREEALAAKETELQAKYDRDYIPRDRLKKDPFAVLNETGVTYDEITQQALNQPKPEDQALQATIQELKSKIASLETAQETSKKSAEDTQQRNYQEAVKQIRNEVVHAVNSNPDFETIQATGASEDVVELITQTFEEEGRLLTVEEAAKQVEDYLLEEALRLARLGKVQKRLAPTSQPTPAESKPLENKQPQQTKTLTNSIGATRPLTAKERAVLAFKGELKS